MWEKDDDVSRDALISLPLLLLGIIFVSPPIPMQLLLPVAPAPALQCQSGGREGWPSATAVPAASVDQSGLLQSFDATAAAVTSTGNSSTAALVPTAAAVAAAVRRNGGSQPNQPGSASVNDFLAQGEVSRVVVVSRFSEGILSRQRRKGPRNVWSEKFRGC